MRLMTRTVFAALLLCLYPAFSAAAYECDAATGLCLIADDDHAMRYDDDEAVTMQEVADATPASTPNRAEPYRSYWIAPAGEPRADMGIPSRVHDPACLFSR